MNKKESHNQERITKGVDGTRPGIDRERICEPYQINSRYGCCLAQDCLCCAKEFLYSVKDKLYPRLLGSDLVASYHAPSCELQFFLPQLKYFLLKNYIK